MELALTVLRVLGAIVGAASIIGTALAGVAGFAYLLFKKYATGWLDNRFKKELADYTHRQNQEIERLRGEIAALLDRATKLHQHEFDVLPKAWDKLTLALGSVTSLTAVYREGIDAGAMSDPELEVFLRDSELEEHQKDRIREANRFERTKIYSDLSENQEYVLAYRHWQDFHNYVIQTAIFIEPQIRAKMTDASLLIHGALRGFKLAKQMPEMRPLPHSENREKVTQAAALKEEIDKLVSGRLWNAAPTRETAHTSTVQTSD